MAYVFNRTLNLLGQPEEKTNVFREQETQGQAPQAGTQPTSGIKTSVEGAINTQAPSSGSGAQQALQRSSLVAPKSQVLKSNIGKTQAPKLAETALSQIKQAGEGLQSEADKYMEGTQTFSAPTEDTLKKATTGSSNEYSDVANLLQKSLQSTEQFKPQQDIQIESAGSLTSPAGVQAALQREGDAEYTRGMGAFDLALLSQNPQFAQTLEAIKRGQETLTSEADKATKDLTAKRLAKEQENLAAAQGQTKTALEKMSGQTTEAGKKAETAFDNQLAYYQGTYTPTPEEKAAWDKELQDFINAESKSALTEASQIYGSQDWGKYLTPEEMSKIDPQKFYAAKPQETDYTQFMSPAEVAQFNSIMSLLGKPEMIQKGITPEKQFGFDKAAYQQALFQQAQDRLAQDLAVEEWKKAGGLEPTGGMGSIPKSEETPFVPNVGSLNIPTGYDQNVTTNVKPIPINTDPNSFPMITGSLAIPDMGYTPKSPVTIKSSSSNRYTNRPATGRGGL